MKINSNVRLLLWICKVICKWRGHSCLQQQRSHYLHRSNTLSKHHLHVSRPSLRKSSPDFQQQKDKCLNKAWVMAKCSNTLRIANFLAVFGHLCTEIMSTLVAFKIHWKGASIHSINLNESPHKDIPLKRTKKINIFDISYGTSCEKL